MITRQNSVKYYLLNDLNYTCSKCRSSNIKLYKVYLKTKILFLEISNTLTEEYLECSDCRNRMGFDEIVKTEVTTKTDKPHEKTTQVRQVYESKGNIHTKTRTIIEVFIPNTGNIELFVITNLLILYYISLKDSSIKVNEKDPYIFFCEHHQVYKEKTDVLVEEIYDEVELKSLILEYFDKCQKEYNRSTILRILSNTAKVLNGKLLIEKDIEKLYSDLFEKMNIPELQRLSFLFKLMS